MTIQYLAFVRLPTEKAHGLQIMKTCEAFAHAGARIELAIGRQGRGDPFATYGVKKNFSLSILRGPDLVSWGSLGFIFSLLWFSEVAARQSAFWEADIIYSRDALILLQYIFLRRTLVYEAHQKPNLVSRFVARRAYRLVVISRALAEAYGSAGGGRGGPWACRAIKRSSPTSGISMPVGAPIRSRLPRAASLTLSFFSLAV